MLPYKVRQTATGVQGDAGTHLLYGSHEGKSKERRPQLRVSKLCASLRIGANTRRIVIRRTRNQPWTERFQIDFDLSQPSSLMFGLCELFGLGWRHGKNLTRITNCVPALPRGTRVA